MTSQIECPQLSLRFLSAHRRTGHSAVAIRQRPDYQGQQQMRACGAVEDVAAVVRRRARFARLAWISAS